MRTISGPEGIPPIMSSDQRTPAGALTLSAQPVCCIAQLLMIFAISGREVQGGERAVHTVDGLHDVDLTALGPWP
jgi:hypothetical protein